MAVLIDPPAWPAHGRLWSHLVSDLSYAELHEFAAAAGIPRRAFEGDHYDVPQERYASLVAAGAREVAGRDLLRALQHSGLRVPKRKGERVLDTWPDGALLTGAGPHHVDVVASRLAPPPQDTVGVRLLAVSDGRVALLDGALPPAPVDGVGRPVGYLRARFDGERPVRRLHLALRAVSPERLAEQLAGPAGPAGPAESPALDWAEPAGLTGDVELGYWLPLLERVIARGE